MKIFCGFLDFFYIYIFFFPGKIREKREKIASEVAETFINKEISKTMKNTAASIHVNRIVVHAKEEYNVEKALKEKHEDARVCRDMLSHRCKSTSS